MRVLMTGSSGMIGTALRHAFAERGDEVVRLVRRPPQRPDEVQWDPAGGSLDPGAVSGFDAVIHLAGAGIGDKRWTDDYRKVMWDSRVGSTELLAKALATTGDKPGVLVSASAIGIYGNRGGEVLTEDSPPAPPGDFLADLVKAWEGAAAPAVEAGIRTLFSRTGIVLDGEGGVLGRILLPFKLGLGGRLGRGDQWWSWVGVADVVGATLHVLEADLEGPVNVTAPNPVTNAEFARILGEVLDRPTILPVPRFALEAVLGKERASALAFTSARVLPARLEASGYRFVHPTLEEALRAELG